MFYVYPMLMKVNRKNRAEVLRVSIFEYDEEEHMRQEREETGGKSAAPNGDHRGKQITL